MPSVILDDLAHPIVQAPLAGGPSTPALAIAVSEAGGLGFVAAGYRSPDDVRADLRAVRAATSAPFGVNLFVPGPSTVDERQLDRYVAGLGPDAGEPRWDDDGWDAKVALLVEDPAPVVSFTFGCPSPDAVASLREAGSEVWITVTNPGEARSALAAGAGALIGQGIEAGGHRASFEDSDDDEGLSVLALLRLLRADTGVPLIATGGIVDGPGVAAALAAGAAAVQLGTAFLGCPEADTHPAHRQALADPTATAITRAFSGRRARGVRNRFMAAHGAEAPSAYPQVHYATAPLRTAARKSGDAGGFNLWAGQTHRLALERPAADVVRSLGEGAREALRAAAERLAA